MASRVTNCPNCGGQVEFKAGSSLLTVCPYCSSAVARLGDDVGELEILGQVAPLVELGSPLSLGTSGRHKGGEFVLVGRVQLDWGQGPWNEWYAAFDDGRWGWVAEAQGKVYLTFSHDVQRLPRFPDARVGSSFSAGKVRLTVVERRRARFVAAEGELPFAIAPGAQLNYCDLQGSGGAFGTLDFGTGLEPQTLFLGEEVRYHDLFDASVLADVAPGQAAAAAALNCPNCGAGIELRAPDEAQRVTCAACGSLLDCSRGTHLSLLRAAKRSGPEPLIPLGSTGDIGGERHTVYGHMVRSVTVDGVRYPWEEYLLRGERSRTYRWLVSAEHHWSFVEPISAGEITPYGRDAQYRGQQFRLFQSGTATVDALRGEFYWKVAIGERSGTVDFVRPPQMLSRELSADEVNWSLGRYLAAAEVEAAFGLKKKLPRPNGIAPHQPNHLGPTLRQVAKAGLVFSALLAVLALVMAVVAERRVVAEGAWPITPANPGQAGQGVGAMVRLEPFELTRRGNLALTLTRDPQATWMYVDGSLVNVETGQIRKLGVQVSSGSDGERRTVFVGSVLPGRYTLQLIPEWLAGPTPPGQLNLRVTVGNFVGSHAIAVLVALWWFPLLVAFRYYGFEKRRWANSDTAE